ncbi:MAG: T9SS type A sorting domain-containing protein [Candidatus Symbiothrix sp.]|jgi:hypothetical protein|nr:T9SS type A sorting domain-containing protein [Candidatus Symbiothrix sp.]
MKEKNKKQNGWILGLLLMGLTIQVSAQSSDTLYVNSESATLVAFDLNKVEKVTFSEQDFSVYDTDGYATTTLFDDVATLSFVRLFANDQPSDIVEVKELELKVYPNPVVDYLTVESGPDIRDVRLFSLTGALLLHKTQLTSPVTLSFSNTPAGVYVLRIETGEGVSFKKIIKN